MRSSSMKIGLLTAVAVAAFVPAVALADGPTLTLRLEPGVAIPLTEPQRDRFTPGADLAIKPTIGITPWLDASPVLSGMVLPSRLSSINAGESLGIGAGLRVKRPHDSSNTSTGFKAVSPWVDGDIQYFRTGPLDRSAWSLAVGASVPTGADRTLWVGPFVRYTDILQANENSPVINSNDAHVLIVGLSFELGARAAKKPVPAPVVIAVTPAPIVVVAKPVAPPVVEVATVTVHERIQFPFDSATPLPEATESLSQTVTYLLAHPGSKVEVQGHASSEGQVEYNNRLSLKRAQAVAAILVHHGVPSGDLAVKGFGSSVPIASNATEEGRAKNRRVEFSVDIVITKVGGAK